MAKVLVNSQGKAYLTGSGKIIQAHEPTINQINITPSTSTQIINTTTDVDGYAPINVSAVTSSIDSNISASNIKNGVTILGVTGTYEGESKEVTLSRILDDSNNAIGTWFMNYTDINGLTYKVICLDAKDRLVSGQICSNNSNVITDLQQYNLWNNCWASEKYTATYNTQKILDFCTTNNYTSSACTHCRSKSYVIDGVTYYGQLPTAFELITLFRFNQDINTMDTTASSYSSTNFSTYRYAWSSTQYDKSYMWMLDYLGRMLNDGKTVNRLVVPVLEIPM